MKNLLTLLAIFIFALSNLHAKQIDVATARIIGLNFLRYKTDVVNPQQTVDLTLVYQTSTADKGTVYFYIFNFQHGFVIVSADDCVVPVLGYSSEKEFRTNSLAPNFSKWLESYKGQIRYAITNQLEPTEEIIQAWDELKNNNGSITTPTSRSSVDPLLHTEWDQPFPYNTLCPEGSVTGCVATAMAQVMKYWNYPETGQGFHSFNHENYGTLSANFGSTTYQWGNMPNSISSSNSAIATLMYHCGVSVDMGYSPEVSGAWVIENSPTPEANCEYAFKNYFGYDPSLQGIERENFNDSQWEGKLKTELNASRPILYDGFGNGGGHAFVCDGFDNNDFFHYNWGWSGYYNGFFETSALNPGGTGTGGGTGGYNSGQQCIIGVKPPNGGGGGGGGNDFTLNLYADLEASSTTIVYGGAFDIHTNIWNSGAEGFSGDYSAAVFDENLNFVDFIEIQSGWTLGAGNIYIDGITFSTNGLLSMLPGIYYAAVFYKTTDGDWSIVANGDYLNILELEVINENAIEVYSEIEVSPSTTLTQGKPASVNLNILNDGNFTFYGSYSVDLYDLSGNWVENIAEIDEPNGLPEGFIYLDPFLTFSSISIDADPGTYLLAVTHTWNGDDYELTGSSYFQNPVFVTVKAPSLTPDNYENNNTVANAYGFTLSFTGNTATKNTNGSTCHTGTDYDYYKITLPAGYDYTITPRIHDSFDSGNGNTYSLDAQFSYSFDGVTWSEAYDDVLPGAIVNYNGGTVYFFAAPYFPGQMGTYLLDMQVTRSPSTAVTDPELEQAIHVFPNPANDCIHVDLEKVDKEINRVTVVDLLGKVVHDQKITGGHEHIVISAQDFVPGLYTLVVESIDGIVAKKIMIAR